MAGFQIFKDYKFRKLYSLSDEWTVLGRHPDCSIILDNKTVNRRHTQILQVDQGYYLEDLNSTNGTYVNGKRLKGHHHLQENDQINLGDVLAVFHFGIPKDTAIVFQFYRILKILRYFHIYSFPRLTYFIFDHRAWHYQTNGLDIIHCRHCHSNCLRYSVDAISPKIISMGTTERES